MIVRILMGVLLFTAVNAFASDWEEVTFGSGVVVSIDNESIRFQGGTAKIWVKWEYMEPQEVPYSYPEKQFSSSKTLELYKCTERTSATIQSIRYAVGGSDVVDSFQIKEAQAQFSEIAPDTLGEDILKWVCKKRPKPSK